MGSHGLHVSSRQAGVTLQRSTSMRSVHLGASPAAEKAVRFPWGFPSLKSVQNQFISRRCFCYNKSACFMCPEIFPWKIHYWLCSLACLVFYLALLALCFSSEKLQVFLFNLQLNAESKRQNAILLMVHPSFRMESISNCCYDYFE